VRLRIDICRASRTPWTRSGARRCTLQRRRGTSTASRPSSRRLPGLTVKTTRCLLRAPSFASARHAPSAGAPEPRRGYNGRKQGPRAAPRHHRVLYVAAASDAMQGRTPLDVAKQYERYDVATLLQHIMDAESKCEVRVASAIRAIKPSSSFQSPKHTHTRALCT
jgi:hypothetical protein